MNATSTLFVAVAVAAPITGAPGAPFVVTGPEGADASEVRPAAFVAVTVNVYTVPAVSPLTFMAPSPGCSKVPDPPAGLDVAVYFVIVALPFDVGAVNATFAVVDPVTVAAPIIGAPGAPITFTDFNDEYPPAPPLRYVATLNLFVPVGTLVAVHWRAAETVVVTMAQEPAGFR